MDQPPDHVDERLHLYLLAVGIVADEQDSLGHVDRRPEFISGFTVRFGVEADQPGRLGGTVGAVSGGQCPRIPVSFGGSAVGVFVSSVRCSLCVCMACVVHHHENPDKRTEDCTH